MPCRFAAIVTLMFFPILVCFAYYADKWPDPAWRRKHPLFRRCAPRDSAIEILPSPLLLDVKNPDGSPVTPGELMKMIKRLQRSAHTIVPEDKAVDMITKKLAMQQPKSRAYYRVQATRKLTRSADAEVSLSRSESTVSRTKGEVAFKSHSKIAPEKSADLLPALALPPDPIVEFVAPSYAVVEAAGSVTVQVRRKGEMSRHLTVAYATEDGVGEAASAFGNVHPEYA